MFGYDLSSRNLDAIRPEYKFDVSCMGTLPVALLSFLESTDYEDAIRNAISLGGDSDTIAVITGGIGPAYCKEMPQFIVQEIEARLPDDIREIWKELEALVRHFAITERKIVVVTGPILPKKKTVAIGANRVTVPTHYYKVIFDLTPPRKMIGFILPNEGSDEPLAAFAVTVDAVEKATGLDFFSALPEDKQAALEGTITIDAWKWPRPKNRGSGRRSNAERN